MYVVTYPYLVNCQIVKQSFQTQSAHAPCLPTNFAIFSTNIYKYCESTEYVDYICKKYKSYWSCFIHSNKMNTEKHRGIYIFVYVYNIASFYWTLENYEYLYMFVFSQYLWMHYFDLKGYWRISLILITSG